MVIETYPLTQTQLGMFLEWNENPSGIRYNLSLAFRLPKNIDVDRFERAIRSTIDAHPVYRTRFLERDGEIVQFSDPDLEIPFVKSSMASVEADAYVFFPQAI